MPTYDYVCDACKHEFELFQSITSEPEKKCPACGKKKLRRLIGPGAAIVFKGSGFHSTDYRSASYHKGAAADKKESAPAKETSSKDGKDAAAAGHAGEHKPAGKEHKEHKKKKHSGDGK